MNIVKAFPNEYIRADDLDGQGRVLVIGSVELRDLADGNSKPVMSFINTDKKLVLNRTNSNKLAELFGTPNTESWTGKAIRVYSTPVEFRGKTMMGVRVHPQLPTDNEVRNESEVF